VTHQMPRGCSNCAQGTLHADTRDITIIRGNLQTTIVGVVGEFCDKCDEIEFDDPTDSAQRYADAGDTLVLQNRLAIGRALESQRKRLKLSPGQANNQRR